MKINGFFVYSFHHDDGQSGWILLDYFNGRGYTSDGSHVERPLTTEFKAKLLAALRHAGWEGDGDVGAMFVPPFFSTEGDNYWFPIYHVKQSNNGTSWIASEQELGLSARET